MTNSVYRDNERFGGNREKAIQRDGEKCVKCGMTRNEHKFTFNSDITVDHIDGKGKNTPYHLKNNDLDNLQTLCLPCHGRKDNRRRTNFDGTRKLRKISEDDLLAIRKQLDEGFMGKELSKKYSLAPATISYIKNNKHIYGRISNKSAHPQSTKQESR